MRKKPEIPVWTQQDDVELLRLKTKLPSLSNGERVKYVELIARQYDYLYATDPEFRSGFEIIEKGFHSIDQLIEDGITITQEEIRSMRMPFIVTAMHRWRKRGAI